MGPAATNPSRVMELTHAFWGAKALFAAVELGLFATLAEVGPQDGEALCSRLGVHPRAARDFFDALVALGLLERGSDGHYSNTPEAALYLDPRQETYLGGLIGLRDRRSYPLWGSLAEAIQTGQPQNEAKSGGDELYAASLYADPARLELVLRGMTGLTLPIARAVAERFPWDRYRSVIDIGTAQGCLPVQVALAHSHLTGGGFDLPQVRPIFEGYVREHDLVERLRFFPGDFFRDPLPSADVLVLGRILHDWDLGRKKALLAKAHVALPEGGALLVYDTIIDDDRRTNALGLLMSLNMLLETNGGFDYTGADCIGWMREVGFRETRVEPLAAGHAMVVGMK